jgi:mono/diheme cytochrome c family protein
MFARAILGVIIACAIIIAAFFAWTWRAAIDPVATPDPSRFDPGLVRRGAQLAALGNCNTCHTAQGGKSFAGGVAVPTPFGTIYSTNITPDPETGIGNWSEAALRRSMHEGVDRAGRHLYPAFPYDHFTLVSDEDDKALYAYLMSRERVRATAPENALRFPFNLRILIAGWKLLFLHKGPFTPVPSGSEAWNRGAYLVEGLAHCGACHTPRNVLGAESKDERFGGGEAEGWTAYALNQNSPAPVPWDADALYHYLRNGWQQVHGVARGPMAPVIDNLTAASDADIGAIAIYIASIAGPPAAERLRKAEAVLASTHAHGAGSNPVSGNSATTLQAAKAEDRGGDAGAMIYRSACADCHESGRPLPFGGMDLMLSTAMQGPNPINVINVVLAGLPAAEGERSPIMPGFAGALSEAQLTDLLTYLRARFSDKPPWTDVARDVRDTMSGTRPFVIYPSHGNASAPADTSQREKPW